MSSIMTSPAVSLIDVSTYLPGEPISAQYCAQFAGSDELRDNLMFRPPNSAAIPASTSPTVT